MKVEVVVRATDEDHGLICEKREDYFVIERMLLNNGQVLDMMALRSWINEHETKETI